MHLVGPKLREEGRPLLGATLRKIGPKPSRQAESGKADSDRRRRAFLCATAMEEPLSRAVAYSAALELIGFGLNLIGDDHGPAVLAVAEALTAELAAVQKSWRQIVAASSRAPARRSTKRRRRA